MNAPVPPDRPPLEESPPFRDWAAFLKVLNTTEGLPERRANEAQKLSAEFSKLIVVNLQFINAGALLAAPSIALNLLGLSGLKPLEKWQLIGIPMGMFAAGLVAASLSSFWAYRNYEMIAHHWEAEREWREFNLGRLTPWFDGEKGQRKLEEAAKKRVRYQIKAQRRFWFSLASGWASILLFICGCVLLAWNAR
ncbi:hypothetical protein [Methylobacterium fujisawaense]|uniref:hypothetical protein n=1 Tax=Methylobacterium fujisawaense TaxID=107400 RepID=UPI002F355298